MRFGRRKQMRPGMHMEFILVAVAIGIAAAAAIIAPLIRKRAGSGDETDFDLLLYKDQLREVELDGERGGIDPEDTARAKLEVSRRMLRASAIRDKQATKSTPRAAIYLAGVAIAVGLVPGALLLHSHIGQPGMPDLPLAQRLAVAEESRANRPSQSEAERHMQAEFPPQASADAEYLALAEQLRAAVEQRPEDVEGLQLLAAVEANLGNIAAAASAKSKAIELLREDATAEDHAEYAELLILNVSGYVSPEAEAAVFRALELDPEHPTALYYAGAMFAQTGRPDRAFHIWRSMLENAPPDDPWVAELEAQIAQVAPFAGIASADSSELPLDEMPGPTRDDVEAAMELTEQERAEMVAGMVDGLEERLAAAGGTPEEWARLIGSLIVLKQTERARSAFELAMAEFGDDPEAAAIIEFAWAHSRAGND